MNRLSGALLAEFLGTLVLILLGDGVVANAILLDKGGTWMVITTGWALAVALGVYVSGRASGGHLNPAVTLALAVRGSFPWARVLPYCGAQLAGAFAGAVLVYLNYSEAFLEFEKIRGIERGQILDGTLYGGAAGGAGVFATYPAFDNLPTNFLTEFLATAVLLLAVAALTDPRNGPPGANLTPLLIGLV